MPDFTFTAGGRDYAVGKMDPRVQLYLLKRLMRFTPALKGFETIFASIRAGTFRSDASVEVEDALDILATLGPIVAETPDADLDFISDACLGVASQRNPDGRWQPVRDPESGLVMNETNLAVVRRLVIVANVLRATFAPMLDEIAPTVAGLSGGADPKAAAA